MSAKERYWLTISALLAATVLVLGGAPVPLLYVLAAAIVVGFLAVGIIFGQLKRGRPEQRSGSMLILIVCSIAVFAVTTMLRNSSVATFTTPIFALALGGTCFLWARKKGPYVS